MRGDTPKMAFNSFPQLKHLMALQGAEKSFDPDKVEREKQGLIQVLSRTASKLEFDRISLLKDRKSPEDELEFIRSLLALSKTYQHKLRKLNIKNLSRYSEILEAMLQNNAAAIFGEIEALESTVFSELNLSDDEKAFFELVDSVDVLEKLFRLEMSPDDFQALEENQNALSPLFSPFPLPLEGGEDKGEGVDFSFLNEWIDDAKAFYVSAIQRENALIENAIRKIEDNRADQAAILAGGFHTEHLAKALKERGFSYVIISPRFVPADSEDHSRKYFEILKYKWDQGPSLTSNPSQGG